MTVPTWLLLCFPIFPVSFLICFVWKLHESRRKAVRPFSTMRRPAGYSLERRSEERWELFSNWLTASSFSALLPVLAGLFIGGDWNATLLTVGVVICGINLWFTWKAMRPLPNMWLGLRGEQCVGAELDALQSDDVRVFHDLIVEEGGEVWNIDHVVLTRSGLFAIETKCRRKKVADEKRHKLNFDGHKVNFPDGSYDTKALNQTRRQADWLSREAKEWTGGFSIDVKAVLVYPGWYVESFGKGRVIVVMEKHIRQLIRGNAKILDDRSWFLLSKQLEKHTLIELPKDPAERRIKKTKAIRGKSQGMSFPPTQTRRNQDKRNLASDSQSFD